MNTKSGVSLWKVSTIFLLVYSDKLRKALGLLNESDYPPYIYRMRELGYPPGYRLLAGEKTLKMYENAGEN